MNNGIDENKANEEAKEYTMEENIERIERLARQQQKTAEELNKATESIDKRMDELNDIRNELNQMEKKAEDMKNADKNSESTKDKLIILGLTGVVSLAGAAVANCIIKRVKHKEEEIEDTYDEIEIDE